jgi:hypothetical protein
LNQQSFAQDIAQVSYTQASGHFFCLVLYRKGIEAERKHWFNADAESEFNQNLKNKQMQCDNRAGYVWKTS